MKRLAPVFLLVGFVACGGGGSSTPTQPSTPTTPTTPAAATVTGLTVTGSGCSGGVCAGQVGSTLQLTATAQLSDGSTQNVTSTAQWTSTNATVATVSLGGLVTFRAAGDADILATYQGKLSGQTMRLTNPPPPGPRTSFGTGQYLVGKDIAAGRYFSAPSSSCYWERQSGLSGSLNDIIANDFVGYNAAQYIVDIKSTDLAFKTESGCGTWNQSARGGLQASIAAGIWLVNAQITPGIYRTNASSGCYWERLRNFEGVLGSIIANDFISGGGQQLVEVRSTDAGFQSTGSCGTWARVTTALAQSESRPTEPTVDQLRRNWIQRRSQWAFYRR